MDVQHLHFTYPLSRIGVEASKPSGYGGVSVTTLRCETRGGDPRATSEVEQLRS